MLGQLLNAYCDFVGLVMFYSLDNWQWVLSGFAVCALYKSIMR